MGAASQRRTLTETRSLRPPRGMTGYCSSPSSPAIQAAVGRARPVTRMRPDVMISRQGTQSGKLFHDWRSEGFAPGVCAARRAGLPACANAAGPGLCGRLEEMQLHLTRSYRREVAHDQCGVVVLGIEVEGTSEEAPRQVEMPVDVMGPAGHRPRSG